MATAPALGPARRHALGMPAGSVRALLAVGILGCLWILAYRLHGGGDDIGQVSRAFLYLQVTMVLVIAHFFAAHGGTIGHHVSNGKSPLSLPRGSVRFLLLGGYLGLTYYMYSVETSFKVPENASIFEVLTVLLTSFVIGYILNQVITYFNKGIVPFWWQDIQAWFALIAMIVMVALVIYRVFQNPDLPALDSFETILAGFVGFYFGSRS